MKLSGKYTNLLLTTLASLLIGAIIMLALGFNPVYAYIELFKGAFIGKLNFGTTIQKFLPLLMTSMAFAVAARVGAFNIGVEGQMYLGAMAAAWFGFTFVKLPGLVIILVAMVLAAFVGAAWGAVPATLKVKLGVNEVCTTILMNYVAILFTSYLVNGPFSAKTGVAQTPAIAESARLMKFLKPSQAHIGVAIGIVIVISLIWILTRSKIGYKFMTVGLNPFHAEYIGIDPKKAVVGGMMLSGAIGGIAGALEVHGTYGYFLDGFSVGIAFDGMLASLIVKNNLKLTPFMAFFLAALKSGALGMERYTGVPKSIVDTIIAIFIIFATMDTLFSFVKKEKQKKQNTLNAVKA